MPNSFLDMSSTPGSNTYKNTTELSKSKNMESSKGYLNNMLSNESILRI